MIWALNIEFAGRQITVRVHGARLRATVERRFQKLLVPAAPAPIGSFELVDSGGTYRLTEEGRECAADSVLENVVERLAHLVAERFVAALPQLLWFHAGAVASRGSAVLLPATWGGGKSTLTSTLAEDGWEYLSDDLAPVDPRNDTVLPFPRTPTVRVDSGVVLPRERVSELSKLEISPHGWEVPTCGLPIGSIVFPSFVAGGRTEIEPCAAEDAALLLIRHCLNFPNHRGEAVAYVTRLVERVEVFRLYYSDSAAGVASIERACRPAGPSRGAQL